MSITIIALVLLALLWTARFIIGFYRGFCEGVVREIAGELAAAIRRAK